MNKELGDGDSRESRDLRKRTKAFALRIVRVYQSLPETGAGQILGRQLLRSGTSVGAHYREACRARSVAEFVSKIEGGLQELEETVYWMELLVEGDLLPARRLSDLLQEAEELTAILAASAITAKKTRR